MSTLGMRQIHPRFCDAWQFHHVSFREELDRMFAQDGAIAALEETKVQNIHCWVLRFIGVGSYAARPNPDSVVSMDATI